jgi:predicted nuclease of restriction endonuclease-like (RecB) superfamily
MINFTSLQSVLRTLDSHFKIEAGKSVNRLLTMRNWLFGFYIVEFQQNGADRAAYGEQLLQQLAEALDSPGFSYRNLKLYRQFYLTYRQFSFVIGKFLEQSSIGQSLIAQLQSVENQDFKIVKSSGQSEFAPFTQYSPPTEKLLSHLSFTHFTLLLPLENPLQRAFYEIESIRGGWSVRELKRQVETLLYERTGLSNDKGEMMRRVQERVPQPKPEDVFRSPYIFEFLGLPDRLLADESELEQALIDHLQAFLLELGNGFCFEARQKRVLFGDDWHFIDLVFYHRILKCHVLVDLKRRPSSLLLRAI